MDKLNNIKSQLSEEQRYGEEPIFDNNIRRELIMCGLKLKRDDCLDNRSITRLNKSNVESSSQSISSKNINVQDIPKQVKYQLKEENEYIDTNDDIDVEAFASRISKNPVFVNNLNEDELMNKMMERVMKMISDNNQAGLPKNKDNTAGIKMSTKSQNVSKYDMRSEEKIDESQLYSDPLVDEINLKENKKTEGQKERLEKNKHQVISRKAINRVTKIDKKTGKKYIEEQIYESEESDDSDVEIRQVKIKKSKDPKDQLNKSYKLFQNQNNVLPIISREAITIQPKSKEEIKNKPSRMLS